MIDDLARRGVDRVVHGGDLALVGCQGAEAVDRIRELGWPGVIGNVDELLWRPELRAVQERKTPRQRELLRLLFDKYAPATNTALGDERIAWLQALPREHREDDVLVVHASPGDLWSAPMPDADDAELRTTYGESEAGVVVYGHIHRPFVRGLERFTVANSGSVGSPFDGDPRASYLLIEDGDVEVVRIDYDIEREAALLLRSGYPDAERIAAMRRDGRFVRPAPS